MNRKVATVLFALFAAAAFAVPPVEPGVFNSVNLGSICLYKTSEPRCGQSMSNNAPSLGISANQCDGDLPPLEDG